MTKRVPQGNQWIELSELVSETIVWRMRGKDLEASSTAILCVLLMLLLLPPLPTSASNEDGEVDPRPLLLRADDDSWSSALLVLKWLGAPTSMLC